MKKLSAFLVLPFLSIACSQHAPTGSSATGVTASPSLQPATTGTLSPSGGTVATTTQGTPSVVGTAGGDGTTGTGSGGTTTPTVFIAGVGATPGSDGVSATIVWTTA